MNFWPVTAYLVLPLYHHLQLPSCWILFHLMATERASPHLRILEEAGFLVSEFSHASCNRRVRAGFMVSFVLCQSSAFPS